MGNYTLIFDSYNQLESQTERRDNHYIDKAKQGNEMKDFSHLDALNLRLSHEQSYLAEAKSEKEKELRRVWIAQIEKEIKGEKEFLGLDDYDLPEMSDDELMAELGI